MAAEAASAESTLDTPERDGAAPTAVPDDPPKEAEDRAAKADGSSTETATAPDENGRPPPRDPQ